MIYKKDDEYYIVYFVGYALKEFGNININDDKVYNIYSAKHKYIDTVPEIYLKIYEYKLISKLHKI